MTQEPSAPSHAPLLEWIAAGVGLIFLLFLLGAIGYDGVTGSSREAPEISIRAGKIIKTGTGYLVSFEAINTGGGTAAMLELKGELIKDKVVVESSHATIDYVPLHGKAEGGLFFSRDPRKMDLEIRPLGFQTP